MKIIRFTGENVKRLKLADITPPPDGLVVISGKNDSGKTSVLDSIWWALGGDKNVQDVPIRRGAESGRIRLDLGDLIVERKFLPSGKPNLTVRNPAGAAPGTPDRNLPVYQSAQEILDALVGRLSFDPLAFARKKPREQYDDLRKVAGINVDFDAVDAANTADFERRTKINTSVKQKLAQAAGVNVPEGLPDKLIDRAEILDRLQEAGEHNSQIERAKARRQQSVADAEARRRTASHLEAQAREQRNSVAARIEALRKQIEDLRRDGEATALDLESQAATAIKDAEKISANMALDPPLPEPVDVSAIRAELNIAESINAGIAQRERRDAILCEARELERSAEELTQRMKDRTQEKISALEKAVFPVPGLSLEAGRVLYKGLPFDQSSGAEILRVSVALAMAQNPKLRVIRIKDGSLLDNDSMELLRQLAKEKDFQIWIECVDSTGKVGIVMEEGEVVAVNE